MDTKGSGAKIVAFYDTTVPGWPLTHTEPAPECADLDAELRKVQFDLGTSVYVALFYETPPLWGTGAPAPDAADVSWATSPSTITVEAAVLSARKPGTSEWTPVASFGIAAPAEEQEIAPKVSETLLKSLRILIRKDA